MTLSQFSENELLEELARRKNEREKEPQITYCDDCRNFIPWRDRFDLMPDDYNPCRQGHKMKFKMPAYGEDPHEFGFYRNVCADRDLREKD